MKKIIISMLACALLVLSAGPVSAAAADRGGFMGFIAGCCFGIRAGAAYNDGKDIHWREWVRIIPYVGSIIGIWDGIEGAQGKTAADYAKQYGSSYY